MAGLFSTIGHVFNTINDTCELISSTMHETSAQTPEIVRNYMATATIASRQSFIEACNNYDAQAYQNALDAFHGRTSQPQQTQQPQTTQQQTNQTNP